MFTTFTLGGDNKTDWWAKTGPLNYDKIQIVKSMNTEDAAMRDFSQTD